MLKIIEILHIEPYTISCKFNNGVIKKIDVKPLLENHKNLDGIDKMYDIDLFKKARIGKLGELYWEKIIKTTHGNEVVVWDYDISPEFVYEQSVSE